LVQLTKITRALEDGSMRNVLTRAMRPEDRVEIDHRMLDVASATSFCSVRTSHATVDDDTSSYAA